MMQSPSPAEMVPLLIPIVGMIGGFAVTIVLGLPLVRVFVRWLESRTLPRTESADTRVRLERIEQAIEGIGLEVERIAEGQRFTTRLLSERVGDQVKAVAPPGEGSR